MSIVHVAQVAQIAGVEHTIGLAILSNVEQAGYALAVVDVASGRVIAADGWYGYEGDAPASPPLAELQRDDPDFDPPHVLLWFQNIRWYGCLGVYLRPHYSLARAAADIITKWIHDPLQPSSVDGSQLMAYFPITEHNSMINHLTTIRDSKGPAASSYNRDNAALGLTLIAGLRTT